jgi:hypothetical protein
MSKTIKVAFLLHLLPFDVAFSKTRQNLVVWQMKIKKTFEGMEMIRNKRIIL